MIKNNIKKLRRSQKLSQQKLEKILDFQQTQISRWELGKSEPSEDDLDALADYFGVSPAYVLGKTLERHNFEADPFYQTKQFLADNDRERDLLEIFRFLDENGKSHLILTAQMLEKYYKG